jgi:hypothetical protein
MSAIKLRILVTASRDWDNTPRVRSMMRGALLREHEQFSLTNYFWIELNEVLVIHGAQGTYRNGELVKGGDMILDLVATELDMRTEPHPADWQGPCWSTCSHGVRPINRFGRDYCPEAGFRRNQEMVDLDDIDVCLAFPKGRSSGTRDCMRRAHKAGIAVILGYDPVVTR